MNARGGKGSLLTCTLPSIHSTPSTSNLLTTPPILTSKLVGAITPGSAQLAATALATVTCGVLTWFSNSRCTPLPLTALLALTVMHTVLLVFLNASSNVKSP